MDVMNVEQAKIAEEAGASAVMALGRSTFRLIEMHRADQVQSESPPTSVGTEVSPECPTQV